MSKCIVIHLNLSKKDSLRFIARSLSQVDQKTGGLMFGVDLIQIYESYVYLQSYLEEKFWYSSD